MPTLAATYVLSTAPLECVQGWDDRALICTTASPYLYLRTAPDNRVLIGGHDEPLASAEERDALLPAKAAALGASLERLVPRLRAEPESVWTGFFMETRDTLPIAGTLRPGVHACLGYGANGNAFAPVLARVVRELITTGQSRDEDVLGPSRAPLRAP